MAKNNNDGNGNVLYGIFGGKAFLKIKSALEIDKMVFSFVSKENAKEYNDIYMNVLDFGGILMKDIKSGLLLKKIQAEKAKGEQYPSAIYTSHYGGCKTAEGKMISRYFNIAPGTKQEVVITAYAYPATEENGMYVPIKGEKPVSTLRVGCDYDELRKVAYVWDFLEADYMSKKYNMNTLRNTYNATEGSSSTANNKPQTNNETPNNQNQDKSADKTSSQETVTLKVLSKILQEGDNLKERSSKPGDYAMQCTNEDKTTTYNVVFTQSVIQSLGDMWNKFLTKANSKEKSIEFTGQFNKYKEGEIDVYCFMKFA